MINGNFFSLLFSGGSMLLFHLNPVMLIIFSGVNTFTTQFYVTPLGDIYWGLLEKMPELGKYRPEAHAYAGF